MNTGSAEEAGREVPMTLMAGRRIRELVDAPSAIRCVRDAFVASHRCEILQPVRTALAGGRYLVMSAADTSGNFAVKAVTVFPENESIPVVQGLVVLFDGLTGSPRLALDGATVTAMRTGAAAGVASDLLADPDASVLAIVGAGGQALDQVIAVCAVRNIESVRLNSRTLSSAERLREKVLRVFPDLHLSVHTTAAQAVRGADVVCTVTTSAEPLIESTDLKERVHINCMGAHTRFSSEVGVDVVAKATIVAVDSLHASQAEAGDLIKAVASGNFRWEEVVEIGALLSRAIPTPTGRTIFKSVGIAAQDLTLAKLIMDRSPPAR